MDNPIKDNRIVNDTTFAVRLKLFVDSVTVCDCASEEEKDYLLMVADRLLRFQIGTATDSKELAYLIMNKVIK